MGIQGHWICPQWWWICSYLRQQICLLRPKNAQIQGMGWICHWPRYQRHFISPKVNPRWSSSRTPSIYRIRQGQCRRNRHQQKLPNLPLSRTLNARAVLPSSLKTAQNRRLRHLHHLSRTGRIFNRKGQGTQRRIDSFWRVILILNSEEQTSLKVSCAKKVKKEPLFQSTVPEWIKSSGSIKITWWPASKPVSLARTCKKNFPSSELFAATSQTQLSSPLSEDGSVPEPQVWKRTDTVILTISLSALKSPPQSVPSNDNKNHQESVQALMSMNSFWAMKEISVSLLKSPSNLDQFQKVEFMNLSFSTISRSEPSSCMKVSFQLKHSFTIKGLASQYQIGRQSTIRFWNVIKNRREK